MLIHSCALCGLAHGSDGPCPVAAPLPVPGPIRPLATGTVVGGRFRIEAVAHRSRMSTVYEGADLRSHGAPVALKEFWAIDLPPEERAEMLAWLAREAGLLSTLNDPRLPRLIAAFSEGERHFLAMPFVDGKTLEEVIARQGPQPETLVLGWGRQLADLLGYLHGQDPPVIHRDLKPANIMLRPDGSLVLLDLGAARPLLRDRPGTAVGTPGYAPPEQYQGLADERSDLFGLGATMHRALTGYNPEQAPPFRYPPVREVAPAVSAQTGTLVAALLHLAPEQRPGSAAGVAAQLVGTLRGVHCRVLFQMYRQLLILLAVAVATGSAVYHLVTPAIVRYDSSHFGYKPADPAGDALRVALVFAPGLLCFLPLFRPGVHALLKGYAPLRFYRDRAAWLVAMAWLMPLIIWLLDLNLPLFGTDMVMVAGQAPLAVPLALGAAGLASLLLLRQCWYLYSLRTCKPLRWHNLALRLCGLFMLGFVIQMLQGLAIYGWGY